MVMGLLTLAVFSRPETTSVKSHGNGGIVRGEKRERWRESDESLIREW